MGHLPYLLLVPLLLLAGVTLYLYNPAEVFLGWICPFHALTGWDCPGCGSMRAVHQLLHGHFAEAFRLNPLPFLLIPLLLWSETTRALGRNRLDPLRRPWMGWVLMAVLVGYAVLRNVVDL